MGRIWSEGNKLDKWLRVELAVCETGTQLGSEVVEGGCIRATESLRTTCGIDYSPGRGGRIAIGW